MLLEAREKLRKQSFEWHNNTEMEQKDGTKKVSSFKNINSAYKWNSKI